MLIFPFHPLLINEMLMNVVIIKKQWARHAQKAGFHLFPAPDDVFAEPYNVMSSPLRCPVYVILRVEIIPDNMVFNFAFIERL